MCTTEEWLYLEGQMYYDAHLDVSQGSGFYWKGGLRSGTTLHPHISPREWASGFTWSASSALPSLTVPTSMCSHTRLLTHNCNYCQGRLCREKPLKPQSASSWLNVQIHLSLSILGNMDWSQSLKDWCAVGCIDCVCTVPCITLLVSSEFSLTVYRLPCDL